MTHNKLPLKQLILIKSDEKQQQSKLNVDDHKWVLDFLH